MKDLGTIYFEVLCKNCSHKIQYELSETSLTEEREYIVPELNIYIDRKLKSIDCPNYKRKILI